MLIRIVVKCLRKHPHIRIASKSQIPVGKYIFADQRTREAVLPDVACVGNKRLAYVEVTAVCLVGQIPCNVVFKHSFFRCNLALAVIRATYRTVWLCGCTSCIFTGTLCTLLSFRVNVLTFCNVCITYRTVCIVAFGCTFAFANTFKRTGTPAVITFTYRAVAVVLFIARAGTSA